MCSPGRIMRDEVERATGRTAIARRCPKDSMTTGPILEYRTPTTDAAPAPRRLAAHVVLASVGIAYALVCVLTIGSSSGIDQIMWASMAGFSIATVIGIIQLAGRPFDWLAWAGFTVFVIGM